jgi:maltooligosyltrehalose trehalohydrolase
MTLSFGATPAARGYRFRVWAPEARTVTLHLKRGAQPAASYPLPAASPEPEAGSRQPSASARAEMPAGYGETGCWELVVEDATAGDRYAYSLDGADPLPDPASRFQPEGVHAWSEIVDPRAFAWSDAGWTGLDPRRSVIYELHVGTFTPEGTFHAAAGKLPYLRDLGITAVELMPLADFAGQRNWGYDGVSLFAPSRAYGRPDDLRAFVDSAHRHGLAVLIDVVYNHLGPEGAYLPAFSPQFLTTSRPTPWGAAVNLDGPGSATVRQLITENALHWIGEYHADGLRLDATHSLFDRGTPHFVARLTAAVHAASNGRALVYAEDHRNLAEMIDDEAAGGWGLDGIWADDFHHVVRRLLAGDEHSYFADYEGTTTELAAILRTGWLYTGQPTRRRNEPRGTDPSRLPLRKSVVCVQNHDQVGNRALGDRLHHAIDAASWRAALTLLLVSPMTPLLFMGQEWAASTPFTFFTDFAPELGRLVVSGRRREFAAFPAFATAEAAERIPDPQADATFAASTLRWDEPALDPHARTLALSRRLLALRGSEPALGGSDAPSCDAEAIGEDSLAFVREAPGRARYLVVVRLRGRGQVAPRALREGGWTVALHTEEPPFAGDPQPPRIAAEDGTIAFERPGAVILSTIA